MWLSAHRDAGPCCDDDDRALSAPQIGRVQDASSFLLTAVRSSLCRNVSRETPRGHKSGRRCRIWVTAAFVRSSTFPPQASCPPGAPPGSESSLGSRGPRPVWPSHPHGESRSVGRIRLGRTFRSALPSESCRSLDSLPLRTPWLGPPLRPSGAPTPTRCPRRQAKGETPTGPGHFESPHLQPGKLLQRSSQSLDPRPASSSSSSRRCLAGQALRRIRRSPKRTAGQFRSGRPHRGSYSNAAKRSPRFMSLDRRPARAPPARSHSSPLYVTTRLRLDEAKRRAVPRLAGR